MSSIREFLNNCNFDWSTGRIVLQYNNEDDLTDPIVCHGWYTPNVAREISHNDPILDLEFDSGYGRPYCPRYFAQDATAIYFPGQYDGSTWGQSFITSIDYYLDPNHVSPYPGG